MSNRLKVLACLTIFMSAAMLNQPMSASAAEKTYYLSFSDVLYDGTDGSAENPFGSLAIVQEWIKDDVAKGFSGTVTVNIGAGKYFLRAPLTFDADIYSSGDIKVIFRGAGRGRTIISGGWPVSGWKSEGGGVWSTDALGRFAGRKPFRYLFKNGKRLVRSRHPNGRAMLNINAVEEKFRDVTVRQKLPAKLTPADNAELVVIENWSISRTKIDHDEEAKGTKLFLTAPAGHTEHSALVPKPGMVCFLENSRSFLDAPDEWYLDASRGKIYFFATEGEDPNREEFIAPLLEKLIVISGTEGKTVKNISFEGISFENTDFDFNSDKFAGTQAGFYTNGVSSPTFEDSLSEPAAIELLFAENISFSDCGVAHTGAAGIGIGKGSNGNSVKDCHIFDIGGNGINIGHRTEPLKTLDADWEKPEYAPKDNAIVHNAIERCGQVNYGSVGIFSAHAQRTLISSNTVTHMPYTGISLGFNWNPSETTTRENIVEYNRIYNVMNTLADGGGIYTLGYQPGTVLRKNIISEVNRSRYAYGGAGNNGIFFDEGSTAIRVEDIIIYGLKSNVLDPPANPVRFNNTKEDRMIWGKNYFGVSPKDKEYPKELEKEILEKAAPIPDAKQ